jgi:hypothetical protein
VWEPGVEVVTGREHGWSRRWRLEEEEAAAETDFLFCEMRLAEDYLFHFLVLFLQFSFRFVRNPAVFLNLLLTMK